MAWGKSRHEHGRAAAPVSQDATRLADRVLLTLIAQTEQLNARLTLLEDRFDASMVATQAPDQADLVDLRAHTERLASELHNVTHELLGDHDNDQLADHEPTTASDEMAIPDQHDKAEPPDESVSVYVDDEIIDLSEQTLRLERPKKAGWQPRGD